MSVSTESAALAPLEKHDSEAWSAALTGILPHVHEVDRAAVQIWFAFYPLDLFRALNEAEDPEKLAATLLLEGNYYLRNQIDSSHTFIYGHRFWPVVKSVIVRKANAGGLNGSLASVILSVADEVAKESKVDRALVVAISAAGLMTLVQSDLKAFDSSPGTIQIPANAARRSAEQILKQRAKDDGQGILGFLKTVDKNWTVVFDENRDDSRYKAVNLQELASAAAAEDKQKWRAKDPRCLDGPIPVQCRSAACGTCWVGVLGGAEKLTPTERLESTSIKRFGYIDTDEKRPLIRLSCQAQATGAVSIVIPPWNGVFGKFLKEKASEKEQGTAAAV